MRRNCNLELRLFPYSASLPSNNGSPQQKHHQEQEQEQEQHQQQLMTIFYNGKICVCDVTEFQARSILLLANREMEESVLMKTPSGSSEPSSPTLQSQVYSPTTPSGLSMKRSLQRFLQKRKNRIQATSPYNHH